uniref:Uncharacterized protein n=1 Tax=Anguilla anguilla TaxID=7936 RepID=A0A0E9PTU8_ANGAN
MWTCLMCQTNTGGKLAEWLHGANPASPLHTARSAGPILIGRNIQIAAFVNFIKKYLLKF